MQKLLETKKVARILEVAKKLPSNLHVESPRDGGEGRLLNKALFGESPPRGPIPYPMYTIFDKRYPFRVSSIEKLYPFHISAS